MKIISISVVTRDPSRLLPYVTIVWNDDQAQTLEYDHKQPLKAIQDAINIRLESKTK